MSYEEKDHLVVEAWSTLMPSTYGLDSMIESRRLWLMVSSWLTTEEKGFLLIDQPERYDLPPAINGTLEGVSDYFGISAFHQVHCLVSS